MDQFGGLDIKTSQEPKLWKKWKIEHFGKNFKKGHYKWNNSMLLEPDGVKNESTQ